MTIMEIYFNGGKQVFADVKGFTVKTDQSPKEGGEGLYPEPFTLFLASLGTCAGIYVKGFCDKRGIDTAHIRLIQESVYDSVKRIMGTIKLTIFVPKDFPEKYENAAMQAASLCPVKRHLSDAVHLEVRIVRE